MNKQTLKKHHFWLLAGVVPLLVLITFLLITGGVGGAKEKHLADLKKAQSELDGRKVIKPVSLINELNAQIEDLQKKKGELWKKNWELQKPYFTTPPLMKMEDLAFGQSIPNTGLERDFIKRPDVYLVQFERMAASVAPTQFLGDSDGKTPAWTKVLRHVNDWGERAPESSWIWMALEDIWVQRALLSAVKSVNDRIATFTEPQEDKTLSSPVKHYKCASRLWEVELWLERQGKDNVIRGKLKNRTDRMQILGVGNTLKLLVWLTPDNLDKESAAVEFHVEGEFVRANSYAQATEKIPDPVIKELPSHIIKEGTPAVGIFKVRQKFDVRTVPVRLIEQVVLNTAPDKTPRDVDARHQRKILLPLKSDDAKDSSSETSTDASRIPSDAAPSPPITPVRPYGETSGGSASPAATTGGTVEQILLANRHRYLVVTQQVRRMPVMIRVVLDQMFVEDFLVAMANLPLRFQTTQVDMTRFRGNLPSTSGPAAPANPGDGSDSPVIATGEVDAGEDLRGAPADPYRGRFAPKLPRPGNLFSTLPASSSNVSEGQLNAGLVSLSVYGIISLYMKYFDEQASKTAKN